MTFFIRYWYFIVIGVLISSLYLQKVSSDLKVDKLEKQLTEIKIKSLEDTNKIKDSYIQYQTLLFENNNAIIEGFSNEIQNINSQFNTNNNKLNSLHQTLSKDRSGFNTASKDSLVNYTSTLSNLFQECGTMVTEVSRRADEATSQTLMYYNLLENNYNIHQELTKDLESKGIKVNYVER